MMEHKKQNTKIEDFNLNFIIKNLPIFVFIVGFLVPIIIIACFFYIIVKIITS